MSVLWAKVKHHWDTPLVLCFLIGGLATGLMFLVVLSLLDGPRLPDSGEVLAGVLLGLIFAPIGGTLVHERWRQSPKAQRRAEKLARQAALEQARRDEAEQARLALLEAAEAYYGAIGQNPLKAAVSASNLLDRAL